MRCASSRSCFIREMGRLKDTGGIASSTSVVVLYEVSLLNKTVPSTNGISMDGGHKLAATACMICCNSIGNLSAT